MGATPAISRRGEGLESILRSPHLSVSVLFIIAQCKGGHKVPISRCEQIIELAGAGERDAETPCNEAAVEQLRCGRVRHGSR
jgi:hypothetical protein